MLDGNKSYEWRCKKRGSKLMALNNYLDQKLAKAYRQDLLREAEQQRLVAQLPDQRPHFGKRAVYGLGVLLVKLGMWLKQANQLREPDRDQA